MNRTEPIQSPRKKHPELVPRDVEMLSAYLDQELNERERQKLETRLKTQPELQAGLDELRHTRLMLRSLPRRKAPRNFTLGPEIVAARRRIPVLFPVFRLSSAIAGLLLVLAFVGQALFSHSALTASPAPQSAAVLPSSRELSGQAKSNQPAQSPPLIISWSTPTPSGQFAFGMGGGGPESSGANLPPATGLGGPTASEAPTREAGVSKLLPPTPTPALEGASGPAVAAQSGSALTQAAEPTSLAPSLAPEVTQTPPGVQAMAIPNSPAADQANSNNPILGVRPAGEAGLIVSTPAAYPAGLNALPASGGARPVNVLGIIQGVLAAIFVGAGGAAIYFYRKESR